MVYNTFQDNNGHVLICNVMNINNLDNKLSIVSVYAPNTDDTDFFQQLIKMTMNCHSHKILIGNFNLTLNDALDRKNSSEFKHLARDVLKGAMEEWKWVDIWRVQNPETVFYAWEKFKPSHKASRPWSVKGSLPC